MQRKGILYGWKEFHLKNRLHQLVLLKVLLESGNGECRSERLKQTKYMLFKAPANKRALTDGLKKEEYNLHH